MSSWKIQRERNHYILRRVYLFIYRLQWVFIAGQAFLQLQRAGATPVGCAGFSMRWFLLLRSRGPGHRLGSCDSQALERRLGSCDSQALERRLSSRGVRTSLFCGLWDRPETGIEMEFLALQGGFLTSGPPGKP